MMLLSFRASYIWQKHVEFIATRETVTDLAVFKGP
jgi:hypothetical protein